MTDSGAGDHPGRARFRVGNRHRAGRKSPPFGWFLLGVALALWASSRVAVECLSAYHRTNPFHQSLASVVEGFLIVVGLCLVAGCGIPWGLWLFFELLERSDGGPSRLDGPIRPGTTSDGPVDPGRTSALEVAISAAIASPLILLGIALGGDAPLARFLERASCALSESANCVRGVMEGGVRVRVARALGVWFSAAMVATALARGSTLLLTGALVAIEWFCFERLIAYRWRRNRE
jgi:hypothetical protein